MDSHSSDVAQLAGSAAGTLDREIDLPSRRLPDTRGVPRVETQCVGSPREMGLMQGACLKEKIHAARRILTHLEAFRLQKPRWASLWAFRYVAERKAKRFISAGVTDLLPEARSRLEGIAQGAGLTQQGLFLLNVLEPVLADLSSTSAVPVEAACSAMAVTGKSSSNGHPILAHNFDYLRAVQPLYTLRESRPAGKLRSLEFTAAPLCGAVDGVNEAGLCITYNYAFTTDGGRPGPTISMWISRALAHCRTVPQAAELLAQAPRAGGGILMLGDAEGRIAALELSSTRSAVRPSSADEGWLFHSNRFTSPEMKAVEIDDAAMYTRRAPQALRDVRVHQSADCRDDRLRAFLATSRQFDLDEIEEVMSDHGPEDQPSADTVCMHSDYWHTTACIRLLPKERRMRVAYDTACRAEYVDFQL